MLEGCKSRGWKLPPARELAAVCRDPGVLGPLRLCRHLGGVYLFFGVAKRSTSKLSSVNSSGGRRRQALLSGLVHTREVLFSVLFACLQNQSPLALITK